MTRGKLTTRLTAGAFTTLLLSTGALAYAPDSAADDATTARAYSPRFKYRYSSTTDPQAAADAAADKRGYSPRFKYRRSAGRATGGNAGADEVSGSFFEQYFRRKEWDAH